MGMRFFEYYVTQLEGISVTDERQPENGVATHRKNPKNIV
jgi:hypothetical protein